MADTYADLQARIADELARTDLTSQIALAILSAVAHHQARRFYFNEATFTFSTVAHQEYYSSSDNAAIATLDEIEIVKILYSGAYQELDRWAFEGIDRASTVSTTYSVPSVYAYFNEQIRLYSIPNAVYTITVAGTKRFTALSGSTDTNPWTTVADAEGLIRQRAKADIMINTLRDPTWRGEAASLVDRGVLSVPELNELGRLTRQTARRETGGRIMATAF